MCFQQQAIETDRIPQPRLRTPPINVRNITLLFIEWSNRITLWTVMVMESYWFICGWNKHAKHKCSQEWTVHYPHDCERTLRLLEKKLVRAQTHRLICTLPKMSVIPVVHVYLKDSPVQQRGECSHCNAAKPIQQCCFTHANKIF